MFLMRNELRNPMEPLVFYVGQIELPEILFLCVTSQFSVML